MKLLDTTVAVDHLRGRSKATTLIQDLLQRGEPVVASELVRFELLAGVREDEIDDLEAFCSVLSWVPVTEDVSRLAGQLARRFRRSHSGIDDVDYLLAATAVAGRRVAHDERAALPDVQRAPPGVLGQLP